MPTNLTFAEAASIALVGLKRWQDGIARILFFIWPMYFLIGFQTPWIVGIFAVFEITFEVLQLGFRAKTSNFN